MGALSPLFLLAGLAAAIPIFLHLFQRHQTRRLAFPALRYLERTEREHARRIRLRQLLLLLARVCALLLVVGAGARLFFTGRGVGHPPTAVVLVLDNSMSSGLVVGERRVLDDLKERALQSLDEAGDEDRFWVIRAGEPWLPALPGGEPEARRAVEETEPSAAAGDLSAALERAVRLLATAPPPNREIHLLSDLQRTAFNLPGRAPAAGLPVVLWTGSREAGANRAITSVIVGGGLPPLEGQRTEITVGVSGVAGDTARVPVRILVDDRIRGAASVPAGTQASVSLPPSAAGWVRGWVDADPDALRADDRRYFAYRARSAPVVATAGDPGIFTTEALTVLAEAGRLVPGSALEADVLVSAGAAGLEGRGPATAALVIPDGDPTLLPALNRRLAEAAIPFRYAARAAGGETDLEGGALPEPLAGVRARAWLDLEAVSAAGGPTRVLAEAAGSAWAVEGVDPEGRRWLLLASALEPEASTLPVSTSMLSFVDWVATDWAGSGGARGAAVAGDHVSAPGGAERVRFPSGLESEIDGTRTVRGTGEAGFYTFLAGDSVYSVVALNPPPGESRLAALVDDDLADAIGGDVVTVGRAGAWQRAVYRTRQGPEIWWPLLAAALVLLLAESLMATSGRSDTPRRVPAAAGLGHAAD